MVLRIKPNRCFRRRATVIVQAVIFGSLVGLGVAALAVDVGLLCATRSELQRTADASALAGASGLMVLQAHERAEQFGIHNRVANRTLVAADLEIVIGKWNSMTKQFTPTPPEGVNGVLPNAVKVTATRSNLELLFARALGFGDSVVTRSAIAVAGSGECAGLWGTDLVTAGGNIVTDSYDSSIGPYGGTNVRPNGDVCSCGNVEVNGSVIIRGDAMYGEGHAFIPSGNSYEVAGIIAEHACDVPYVDADYAVAETQNNNDNIPLTSEGRDPFRGSPYDLVLTSSDQLTLPPGTYYFDSVRMTGQSSLNITGPTTIYIKGESKLAGGGVMNVTQNAANLTVYSDGPQVELAGDSAFYGTLIAPNSEVVNRGNFNGFGTVISRVLDVSGNVNFHVDEGLVHDLFEKRAVAPILVK